MYAAVRRYKTKPGAAGELMRRVEEGFIPIVSQVQGFISYYAVDTGNDEVASINVFADQAGMEESTRRAADWVRQNMADLVLGPPDVTAGEVIVSATK